MSQVRRFRVSREGRRLVLKLLLHLLLIALSFVFSVPMLWVFSTSLKRLAEVFVIPIQWIPLHPQWQNYVQIWGLLPLSTYILNTLKVSILGALGSVLSSLVVGFGLSHLRWRMREAVFALVLGTMMLPGVVTIIPQFVMFSKVGWVNTHYPLYVPSWFGEGFYIFLMRQFMLGLPYELDEAARIDGAGSLRILFQLIAPMCKPVISTVAIFSFLAHYNDFMSALIYLSKNELFTLPLGLAFYAGRYGMYWHLVMAVAVVSVIPIFFLFWIGQRYFVQGVQMTGLAGR